jgi:hypothetical protein
LPCINILFLSNIFQGVTEMNDIHNNATTTEDIVVIVKKQSVRASFKERLKIHKEEAPVRSFGQVAHAIFEAIRTVSYNTDTKNALQKNVEKVTNSVPSKEYNNSVGRLIVYQMALQDLCDDPKLGHNVCQLLRSTPVGGDVKRNSIFNEPFQNPSWAETAGHMLTKLTGSPEQKDEAQAHLYYARKARRLKL